MKKPLVSVLMPVNNASAYISEALKSLLIQDYPNLEIIIVDDGCTDDTLEKVYAFADSRIVVLRNPRNEGLAESLNRAIRASSGEFLARMDADDVAHPHRFSRQVQFMTQHPEIDVLGTAMQYFGYSSYRNYFPENHEACISFLLLNVCFGHPSVMFRRRVFSRPEHFYNPSLRQYSEEYDLWCRLAPTCRFHNLREVLLYYRTYPPSVKNEAEEKRKRNHAAILRNYLSEHLFVVNDEQWACHAMAALLQPIKNIEDVHRVHDWLVFLTEANYKKNFFNPNCLQQQFAERFFELCYTYAAMNRITLPAFYQSRWRTHYSPKPLLTVKFLVKHLKWKC